MGTETKPTARFENPTLPAGRGVISVQRIPVPATGITVSIPEHSRKFSIKNVGNVELRFNFNDDTITNYDDLARGERSITLDIIDTTTINLWTGGGPTDVSITLWG